MKKLLILILPVLNSYFPAVAQNTYPATGNVGIGTSNPTSALQIFRGGTNATNDYPSLTINTNGTGNLFGPILYLNAQSGNNGRMWGLVSSGELDVPTTGASGNFSIFDTQAGSRLVITTSGNVGVGTTNPNAYVHGGNNRVLEVYNPNTSANSQSHIILSTGSVAANSSAGSITWISKNSSANQCLAYIAALTQGDATSNSSGNLIFATANSNPASEKMRISSIGNLLIGQTTQLNTAYKLDVNGSGRFNTVVVNSSGADFVFKRTYHLRSLQSVQKYISANSHLPEIATAEEMQKNGIDVAEMNRKLLQKVEELTLYIINQDARIKKLESRIAK